MEMPASAGSEDEPFGRDAEFANLHHALEKVTAVGIKSVPRIEPPYPTGWCSRFSSF
jgi:hypothetical protein